MRKAIAYFNEPTDFSLVQGGPLFQLLLAARLQVPPTGLLIRRIVAVFVISWVPLQVLTLMNGTAWGGVGVPFFHDIDAHVRLLLCAPFLLAAEVIVHGRIKDVVKQFLDRGLVAPKDQDAFAGHIASAMRLRNSVVAEVVLIAMTYAMGYLVWKRHFALQVPTWMAESSDGEMRFTPAGSYYFFVNLAIVRFLSLRWLFRLLIWYRFLWHVARRVPLQLNALHPDRAGGLGFLAGSVFAFAPFLLTQTISVAGVIGGKITHESAKLPEFKMEIVAWMVFLMLIVLTPLFFFVGRLGAVRREGLREYGIVGSRYVNEFKQKWIDGGAPQGESIVGSGDIQSLADLSNSFQVVQEMSLVPFGKTLVIRMAIFLALPFLPLLLTIIPLEQLIDRAMGVFF